MGLLRCQDGKIAAQIDITILPNRATSNWRRSSNITLGRRGLRPTEWPRQTHDSRAKYFRECVLSEVIGPRARSNPPLQSSWATDYNGHSSIIGVAGFQK
jgi:hypothetical protein